MFGGAEYVGVYLVAAERTEYAHRVRSGAQARACIDGLPSDVRGSGGVRRAPSYVAMEEGVSGRGEEPR